MKRFFCSVLAVLMSLSILAPVYAGSSDMSWFDQFEQLKAAAQAATTDEEATEAMNALIYFFEHTPAPIVSDVYPGILDAYVSFNSVTWRNGILRLNYEVLAIPPSGASVTYAWTFPEATRIPAKTIQLGTVGTHTLTLDVPNCGLPIQVYGRFIARDFKATKVFFSGYGDIIATSDYHVVTASDVTINKIAMTIGSVATFVKPTTAVAKLIFAYGVLTIAETAFSPVPALVVGQTYVVTTVMENGVSTNTLRIYSSLNDFKNNADPIYQSTTKTQFPHF